MPDRSFGPDITVQRPVEAPGPAACAHVEASTGVLAVGAALAACSTPTPSIVLTLSNKDEQKCPSTDCTSSRCPVDR